MKDEKKPTRNDTLNHKYKVLLQLSLQFTSTADATAWECFAGEH